MNIKLPIYSLNIIDSISFQKCLIPKDKFPGNIIPGQWAKCFFTDSSSGKQYYAVAQTFPRADLSGLCYLDTIVSNYENTGNQKLLLENCMFLENKKEIEIMNVVFYLNPEYFIEHSSSFTKSYLEMLANIWLQQYHLTAECLIRDQFLLDNGIEFIYVEIEDSSNNCVYFTTDSTRVHVKNISLKYKVYNFNNINFDAKPFAKAQQELNDLIKIVHMQRSAKKLSLHMNINALVVGAVGSGKTSIVEQFLQDHHCNVFNIKVTSCLKQYPGETEAELRKIFKAACNFETRFKAKGEFLHFIF